MHRGQVATKQNARRDDEDETPEKGALGGRDGLVAKFADALDKHRVDGPDDGRQKSEQVAEI